MLEAENSVTGMNEVLEFAEPWAQDVQVKTPQREILKNRPSLACTHRREHFVAVQEGNKLACQIALHTITDFRERLTSFSVWAESSLGA